MKTLKLNNGLTIIFDKTEEDFVNLSYVVNKGALDEPEDCRGIAHLAEHMVFKGTANRNKNQLWVDVQRYGGNMNAWTTDNHIAFYVTILKEYWKEGLDVISDIVWNNTLPQEEFELEKSVVIEELRMYQDDGVCRVNELCYQTMYPNAENHWYTAGTPESVETITLQQLRKFIKNFFIPTNLTLFVIGNVEEEKIVEFLEEYLQDYKFPTSSEEYREIVSELTISEGEDFMTSNQSHLLCYFPLKINDLKEYYLAKFASFILGSGFCSRLMVIREEYGYAYTVKSSVEYSKEEPSFEGIYVGLNLDNVPKTIELIKENIDKLIEDGITEDEFEAVQNTFISNLKQSIMFCEDKNELYISLYIQDITLNIDKHIKILNDITKEEVETFIKNNYSSKIGTALIKQVMEGEMEIGE